jgi:4'-phosphopantetheinyl transferase
VSSGAPIGVDLEFADRRPGKPMSLARRYFSQQEIEALSTLGEEDLRRAFMHTWASKEAIVKASGLGIANQLCRFSVDINPDRAPCVIDMLDDDPGAWKLVTAESAPGSIAVVAVRQEAICLEGFKLSK